MSDVTVSDPNTVIEEGAFLYEHVTLHGAEGSLAQQYAKEHDLPFEVM